MPRRGAMSVLGDAWRTQLWPLPALGVGVAVLVGVLIPLLEVRIDDFLPAWTTTYLFGGGPGAARTVLDAIAISLITVTSLTFSLTIVTLHLASSQFSPRLLRTFTSDRVVHVTLALFLATFAHALTVLRTVRTAEQGQGGFVPQISVTVSFLLALASAIGLVMFLAHLVSKIRVETMLRDVHTDASATIGRTLPRRSNASSTEAAPPVTPTGAVPVPTALSGFLSGVDETALLTAAVDADAVVVVDRPPGSSSLIARTPVGACWPRTGSGFDRTTRDRLTEQVAGAILTGHERTAAQDVAYGLRQLTDVAVKALFPGINDPTTAVHALGHSSALLCELAGRDLGPRLLRDDDDRVRVVLSRPDLADLLDLAVAQPRRYGAADPAVLTRLLHLLRELAWTVDRPEQHVVIAEQLTRLRSTIAAQDLDAAERAALSELAEQVEQAADGRWGPARAHPECPAGGGCGPTELDGPARGCGGGSGRASRAPGTRQRCTPRIGPLGHAEQQPAHALPLNPGSCRANPSVNGRPCATSVLV